MERHLGVLVNGKLNLSQQCPGARKANPVLGGIRHSITAGFSNILLNIDCWVIWYKVSKSADNIKLCGVVNMLEGRDAIQRDFNRLEW
ncbi:hypothetical protein TURU_004666 [Turdus rufiventris]|nr:hypothetical protein TURU_004666 [Turdus rufiventris]